MAYDNAIYLDMEGTDESTDFIDISPNGHTVTANGNAQIDTAQKAVGNSSCLLDGTGDYLSVSDDPGFNLAGNNFVISLYFRLAVLPSANGYYYFVGQGSPNWAPENIDGWNAGIFVNSDNIQRQIIFEYGTVGGARVPVYEDFTFVVNTWYKFVITRDGADLTMEINGAQIGSTHNIGASVIDDSSFDLLVGAIKIGAVVSRYVNGWIDELYIINGDLNVVDNPIDGTESGAFCPYVEVGQVRKMVDTISGLDHLEGEAIEIQMDGILPTDADGALVTNSFTVASGSITLPKKAAVVHAGLPYDGLVQLLKASGGSAIGSGQFKVRRSYSAVVRFFKSLGLKVGYDEDNLDPMFDGVPALPLKTEDQDKLPSTLWDDEIEMVFKMEDPLPCFILAILLESDSNEKG